MKKNIFYAILLTASLSSCGSSESDTVNDSKTTEKKEVADTVIEKEIIEPEIDLSFNMPEKEVQQLTNAKGSIGESYKLNCFSFKGDNATLDVYLNSFDLEEKEYPVNVDDMSTPDILISYKITTNGETSDCCGNVEIKSKGGMTITSISEGMISGEIDVDNYDGSSIKGSFNIKR